MIENVSIEILRILPGASASLPQKTARVRLVVKGDVAAWSNQCAHASAAIAADVALLLPTQTALARHDSTALPQVDGTSEPLQAFAQAVLSLCIALQREARDAVWRGEVLQLAGGDGTHQVTLALPHEREAVLKAALQWAARCQVVWGRPGDMAAQRTQLINTCRNWLDQVQAEAIPPNTLSFALAAFARGWPVQIEDQLLHIGWGRHRQTFDSSFTGRTPLLAARTARDKHLTSRLLHRAGLPVPPTSRVSDWEGALKIAQQLGWPVVIKPSNQDQGTAVVPGIRDEATLRAAFDRAAKFSPGAVIVEKHIAGDDHRLLVVQGQLLMATRRVPGGVTGDGCLSITQLITQVNADPRRGTGKRNLLIQLALDDEAQACLAEQALSADSVPSVGQFVRLRRTANISTGGTAEDVSAVIHADNRLLAERAARTIGLDIAGVDFLCPDISRSWRDVGGAICEVNAQPGFRPHWLSNPARDINGEILDLLFADQQPRIPTAAVTGTNGKTTVCRMLHHIWQHNGKVCGVSTTQGVWVGNELLTPDNLSGLPGARMLLADPAVEAAVLEMPRKGLIRFGHACDEYDVAALLNVQDDHIGSDGIESLQQMAELKAEVLQRARRAIVINADDDLCLAMRPRAGTDRHLMVARDAGNPALSAHRQAGGESVFTAIRDDGQVGIILATGMHEIPLMPLHAVPATMNGLLKFNEQNALFAIAIAWAQGVSPEVIRRAMAGFSNTPEQNPGRYNFIDRLPFQILLDYGHNPDGLKELFDVAAHLPVSGSRRLISVIGNRFRHHFETQVPWMLQTFDVIHLAQDEAYFQKNAHGFGSADPIGSLLALAETLMKPHLRPGQQLFSGRKHLDVLQHGLASASPGDLVVILAEPNDVMPLIEREQRRYAIHGDQYGA